MALVAADFSSALIPKIVTNLAPGQEPPRSQVAGEWADAFEAYWAGATLPAPALSPFSPGTGDRAALVSKIVDALNLMDDEPAGTATAVAEKIGEGMEAYWLTVQFGTPTSTPTIVVPPTAGTFADGWAGVWTTHKDIPAITPPATVLVLMDVILDLWTKLIQAGDPLVPPPPASGTPPGPIL